MNTQENNKLIAEFMGLIIRDKEGNLPTCSQQHKLFVAEEWDKLYLVSPYSPNGPDYHKSWDWLMPVVDKIESFQDGEDGDSMRGHLYNFRIEQHFVYILDGESMDVIIEMNGDSKLDATYNAVVEFINQYNKTK